MIEGRVHWYSPGQEVRDFVLFKFSRRQEPKETFLADLSDDGLLRLFRSEPRRAWDLFLDRYSNYILSVLRHMGFDHDEAMDRFVFVC